MWLPSYLMSISCRPLSVGWYLMVMVPSLLSVICGLAVLPEGIRTSPDNESDRFFWSAHAGRALLVVSAQAPEISPCCGVKGTRKLTGLKRGSTVSRGATGSFDACRTTRETVTGFVLLQLIWGPGGRNGRGFCHIYSPHITTHLFSSLATCLFSSLSS